jgi:hypothetical protein
MKKKKQTIKTAKEADLLEKIRVALSSGKYQKTEHAKQRAAERGIIIADYEYVLKTGNHESKKDKFDEMYNTWNYAIRGKTIDKRELRVVITFDEDGMLLITVIDLDLEGDE